MRPAKTDGRTPKVMDFLFPRFSEYEMFFVAILLVLLQVAYHDFFRSVYEVAGGRGFGKLLIFLFIAWCTAMYYAFSKKQISMFARPYIVLFVGLFYGFLSFMTGRYLFATPGAPWYLKVLAIYLFVRALAMVIVAILRQDDERVIYQHNAQLPGIVVVLLATVFLLYASAYLLHIANWATAASFVITIVTLCILNPIRWFIIERSEEELSPPQ